MMTSQRRKRLKNKIEASRGRIMEQHPYFAVLLMYLKYVAVSDMKRMSTNGRCIYFSPNFADKLYEDELDFVLCHQIMHIILGHIWRPSDRESDDYHFACDIHANALLADCGFTRERYAHLGNIFQKIPSESCNPCEMTPEEIYERLPYSLYLFDDKTRDKFLTDDDCFWEDKDDIGNCGEIIIDVPEDDCLMRDTDDIPDKIDEKDASVGEGDFFIYGTNLQQSWQKRASFAVSLTAGKREGAKGFGDTPDFAKRMYGEIGKPTVDWKRALDSFIQDNLCDYSFSPPDRRFSDTGFFLPDFNEKEFAAKDVLFMVDTSGSVDFYELTAVYSEIYGAIEQFRGKLNGKLGFFDTKVTPPLPFDGIDDLTKIMPYGGGGTNFRAIFDYLHSNRNGSQPSCVIIFTDGDGPYPPESEAMGIPILWVINNLYETPPFGKVIRMITESGRAH